MREAQVEPAKTLPDPRVPRQAFKLNYGVIGSLRIMQRNPCVGNAPQPILIPEPALSLGPCMCSEVCVALQSCYRLRYAVV